MDTMDSKKNKDESDKQKMAEEETDSPSAAAHHLVERGSQIYGQVEQTVTGAYDKTSRAIKDTYDKTRAYSGENPGKTILVLLGIGVGMGILLGATTHHLKAAIRDRMQHNKEK